MVESTKGLPEYLKNLTLFQQHLDEQFETLDSPQRGAAFLDFAL